MCEVWDFPSGQWQQNKGGTLGRGAGHGAAACWTLVTNSHGMRAGDIFANVLQDDNNDQFKKFDTIRSRCVVSKVLLVLTPILWGK